MEGTASELGRMGVSVTLWAIAVLVCAGLTGAGDRRLRRAAIVVAFAAVLAGLIVPPRWILARFAMTALGVLALGRSLDLSLRSTKLGLRGRLWLLLGLFDVRHARREPPRLDGGELGWLLVHGVVVLVTGLLVVRLAPQLDGPARWLVRWGCGAPFCFALIEALQSILLIAYGLGGVVLPRINAHPIRSTTLAEFWGRRWNRVVSGWLRDYLFLPRARRGRPTVGIYVAFAASTVLHFWLAWVPLDVRGGVTMASFFMVQAGALVLERRLGVASWARARRRAWTIAWLLLFSPLFVEPALRILLVVFA
jgi:hypothetical protein